MAEQKKEATKAGAEKPAKKDKPGLFTRIAKFFRDYKSEMKKIVWAGPKSVVKNSVMVIITIAVVALVVALLDFVFAQGITGLNEII